MSRIPPIALRIACNTRHYECSGISSYYYSNQFLANLACIQNVKTLGQQLIFPIHDIKPKNTMLAILPCLFPVNSILNSRHAWNLKLKNIKPFFYSKNIGFASSFIFDTFRNQHINQQKIHRLTHKALKKQNYNICLSFISKQYQSKLQKKQSKFKLSNNDSPLINNQYRLKQILVLKKFRPTHVKNVFYLACSALINQCQAKKAPIMTAKKNLIFASKNKVNRVSNKNLIYESLKPYTNNDLRQTIHHGVGIPKCFISRSCDQNANLHLWHILPYNYIGNTKQKPITKVNKNQQYKNNSGAPTKYSNNNFNKSHNNNDCEFNTIDVLLFNMYDSGQNVTFSTCT